MKILKSLNRINYLIILIFLLTSISYSEDKPVDIWNIKEVDKEDSLLKLDDKKNNKDLEKKNSEISIYQMQSTKKTIGDIELEENTNSKDSELFGLYDPEDYGLDINMWINSDGDQLKNIFSKLKKIKLSNDAKEIVKISLLTNAHYPTKNISKKEFLEFKSDWMIKNSDLELIENYIIKNEIINIQSDLTKYIVDQYLSLGDIEKACNIFKNNSKPINNEYLSNFNIYCLIKLGKKDEAQILFDLKKELGFKDEYFEEKINFLFGYNSKIDDTISEKSILYFHLAFEVNPNLIFEPKDNTDKIIWKYLSSFNLLGSFQEINISELEKISIIEKAVHNKNYSEQDLFKLYKRFQFNINQLLNVKNSYKSLNNIEGRALIYQKILLESEMVEKLKLLKLLKDSFDNDDLTNAFDIELKKFLSEMNPQNIPDNLTSFYYTNLQIKENLDKKIRFNNDVMHQSKLVNYFNGDYSKSKIEKDLNNYLKKIKKDKKYFFSKKDIIFIESLRSDGIEIDKKYNDFYTINPSEIPTDIQVMINNSEKGAALLRIAEVIGQDELDRIDEDTIYFIIITLNQLNIDLIRNKILLKVLPLKV